MITARALVLGAAASAIVLRGSTTGLPRVLYCALVALALAAAALRPLPAQTAAPIRAALALAAVLAAWLFVQCLAFPGNPLANPIWQAAEPILGAGNGGAISVAPSLTREAILPLVAPLLLYVAALAAFPTDRDALRLWRLLGFGAAIFALAGMAQLALFPRSFFFVLPKTAYVDSLTGFLVNRNSAGTLLGAGGLVLFGAILAELRSAGGDQGWRAVFAPFGGQQRRRRRLIALAAAWAVVFVALVLTRSRGAVACTLVAYAAAIPLTLSWRTAGGSPGILRRYRPALLAIAAVVLLFALFGGRVLLRQQVQGIDADRLCTYQATLRAFLDHWQVGTGFGTFPLVFPGYRDPDCATIHYVWLRAHNVWLEALMGLGVAAVPAILLPLGFLGLILWRGQRERRRLRSVPAAAIGIVVLATLHGMVDFSLQIPGVAAFLALTLAAATTISLRGPRARRPAEMQERRVDAPPPSTATGAPAAAPAAADA